MINSIDSIDIRDKEDLIIFNLRDTTFIRFGMGGFFKKGKNEIVELMKDVIMQIKKEEKVINILVEEKENKEIKIVALVGIILGVLLTNLICFLSLKPYFEYENSLIILLSICVASLIVMIIGIVSIVKHHPSYFLLAFLFFFSAIIGGLFYLAWMITSSVEENKLKK